MTLPAPHRSFGTSLAASGSTWRADGQTAGAKGISYREKSIVLTSALHEYRRLREEGKTVSAGEFCERYPDYRKSLIRLIDVEENIGDLGEMHDPFPVVGGDFLGFEIIDELGMGAVARVYLASEPALGGRIVVIKVSADGTAEAATLGKLQHPNIVQVYSVQRNSETGMTAVCMPYQGSATLTDVLDLVFQSGRPPEVANVILDVTSQLADMQALRDDDLATSRPDPVLEHGSFADAVVHWGIQLAEALEYAHAAGVLHRDLKPSNILLTPHGRPMLLDFNLSFDAAQDAMPRGGTLPYMAPEQIRASIRGVGGADLDPRPDIFSLGVILYELVTGNLPYGGPPEQLGPEAASLWQLNAHETKPTAIREINPRIPAKIAAAIERCIATDENARFATLPELKQVLRTHFSRQQRAARWVSRHRKWCQAAIAVLVVALSICGTYLMLRPPLHERQYLQAAKDYHDHKYDRVIASLTPVIKDHPDFTRALTLRAACFIELKQRRDAITDLKQVALVTPTAAIWDNLGYLSFRLNENLAAVEQFENAIRLEPKQATLHLKCAIAALRDDVATAEKHVMRALELNNHLTEAYLVRAEIRFKTGNVRAGLEDLDFAAQLPPDSKWVHLFVTEKLWVQPVEYKLEEKIRHHLTRAVELGLTKAVLRGSNGFIKFQRQPWCIELLSKAEERSEARRIPLQDALVPAPLPISAYSKS